MVSLTGTSRKGGKCASRSIESCTNGGEKNTRMNSGRKVTNQISLIYSRKRSKYLISVWQNAYDSEREFHQENNNTNESNKEFIFGKGWRRTNPPSVGSDMWSGDLFSRELSSTTSMRGTLCYVAPEADIYSLGVLILVIISGRRPLHVLSSSMKLEKANLISWCRHLAHSGNVLELVDERMRDEYDENQARLCINLAVACLQKMPELRPDVGDVVKILKGEMELPSLPFALSPSPPSKCFSISRKKQKGNQEY